MRNEWRNYIIKGRKSKARRKKDIKATESSKALENPQDKKEFNDFDVAYQLAIVMKIFQDVTIKYDYAIGNPVIYCEIRWIKKQ